MNKEERLGGSKMTFVQISYSDNVVESLKIYINQRLLLSMSGQLQESLSLNICGSLSLYELGSRPKCRTS